MGSLYGIPDPTGRRKSNISGGLKGAGNAPAETPAQAVTQNGYVGYLDNKTVLGQPFAIWLGMVLLLFFFKWFSEHDKTPFQPMEMAISGYNVIAVGVAATVFIVILKVIVNRYPIPGLLEFANFI